MKNHTMEVVCEWDFVDLNKRAKRMNNLDLGRSSLTFIDREKMDERKANRLQGIRMAI